MAFGATTLAVVTLLGLCFVASQAQTYSQLSNYTKQWSISIQTTTADGSSHEPHVCSSQYVGDPCNVPVQQKDRGDTVLVNFSLKNATINTYLNGTPTTVLVRICYSADSSVDRKWRKAGTSPTPDNSCPYTILSAPYNTSGSATFVLSKYDELAPAVYYVQVLVKCGTSWCQYDATKNNNYFETDAGVYITTNMIIWCSILSALGPLFLAVYGTWDYFSYKRKWNI